MLKFIFGQAWIDRYVDTNRAGDFLYAKGEIAAQIGTQKLVDLAEMIFNFQFYALVGLNDVLDKIAAGNLEAAYAELDTGKMLVRMGVTFGFHPATGQKGTSYDFDVQLQNGKPGCAETECKLSSTELREKSIKDTLNHARKQLPKEAPSVILLKTPQAWLNHEASWAVVKSVVEKFLKETARVVSVVFYSERIIPTDRGPRDGFRIFEMPSHAHRFGKDPNWRLLPPRAPEKMDIRWISLWNMYDTLKITGKTDFEGFEDAAKD